MTATAPPPPLTAKPRVRTRALAWALHLLIPTIAVLSLATGQIHLWIDLRLLGSLAFWVALVWTISVLAMPFACGPRLAGLPWNARWITPAASRWQRLLPWPTYLILACLLVNLGWYVMLFFQKRADGMLPAPLIAFVVLAAWLWLIHRWRQTNPPAAMPAKRYASAASIGFGITCTAVVVALFFMYSFSRSPAPDQTADLAVVLGGRLNEDGTPSITLRDRVLAAAKLYREGRVKHILLSGGNVPVKRGGPRLSEALSMKAVCLAAGVPEEAISLDPVGVNTKTTAVNTRAFMQARQFDSVIICSSNFHLYRTLWCFERAGVKATTVASAPADWRCADPREAFRELMGNIVYQLVPTYREPKVLVMKMQNPRVVVHKKAGLLELFDGTGLVKKYTCISGRNEGDKNIEGDARTPLGTFRIVYKNPQSKFHLSLGLDYPNREDAQRGLDAGLITRAQYQEILEALNSDLTKEVNQKKLWYTKLGGEIFLHGEGEGRSGTAGCVALSNKDIEELYEVLPLGTEVQIVP